MIDKNERYPELSERDLEVKKLGFEGLAVVEALVEGVNENNQTAQIERAKKIEQQLKDLGIPEYIDDLPFYTPEMEAMESADFYAYVKRNPLITCEYVGTSARFCLLKYLQSKSLNARDVMFDIGDERTNARFESQTVAVKEISSNDEDISKKREHAVVRAAIATSVSNLIENGFISRKEFEEIKSRQK